MAMLGIILVINRIEDKINGIKKSPHNSSLLLLVSLDKGSEVINKYIDGSGSTWISKIEKGVVFDLIEDLTNVSWSYCAIDTSIWYTGYSMLSLVFVFAMSVMVSVAAQNVRPNFLTITMFSGNDTSNFRKYPTLNPSW